MPNPNLMLHLPMPITVVVGQFQIIKPLDTNTIHVSPIKLHMPLLITIHPRVTITVVAMVVPPIRLQDGQPLVGIRVATEEEEDIIMAEATNSQH